MQRYFNGRYLLFAVAVLTVWMLTKSRSPEVGNHPSWTELAATNQSPEALDASADQNTSLESAGLAANALSGTACDAQDCSDAREFDEPFENLDGSLDEFDPIAVASDPTLTGGLDTVEISHASEVTDNTEATLSTPDVHEQLAATIDESNDFAFAADEKRSVESSSAHGSVQDLSAKSFASTSFASAKERANQPVPTAGMVRIENKFADDATDTITKKSNKAWRKNPYADNDVVLPTEPTVQRNESSASVLDLTAAATSLETPAQSAAFQAPDRAPSHPEIDGSAVAVTDSTAQKAAHHIEYGKSLARRGASYGARQEFFTALGVIAQSNDAQVNSGAYTLALRRAIQALREASDFTAKDAETQIGMNIGNVLETHSTRIISAREAAVMTPVQAMQRYFTFAHQQLGFAGGRNVVTAEALFCLGKLHTVMAKHQPETLDIAKAIVFHRAALSSDAQNYRSANELGVLLARSGQLDEAEDLIKQSLVIRSAPQPWQNLARIHQRKGEGQLSQLAQSEFIASAQMDLTASSTSHIRWVGDHEFNQLGPADFHESMASANSSVVPASRTAPLQEETPKKKSLSERFEHLNPKKWF